MTEALLSLISATALLLGSPGPATLGLAGVGATFGIRGGLNFLGGVLVGLCVVIVGAGLGLAALFAAFPSARLAVQIIGGLYICYIATKIALAPHIANTNHTKASRPKFIEGFILNLLNPKAYAAFLALFSQFLLPFSSAAVAFIITAVTCFLVAVFVDTLWLSFGGIIRPLFRRQKQARIVRVIFAVLMITAVLWAFTQ
ncbi:LysE family translocator [Microbulbifer sp. TYP-18]|uniref:LysE family translocator n=1 Tax=Microbulbifer sp. TYP-18 TaxID=3230024 RepID=UPI0034C67FD6